MELLPDREKETIQAWLQAHPEVLRITRDRYPRFKEAMEEVRPDLYHIHDRFHLIHNLWDLHDEVMKKVLPSKIRKNGESEVPVIVTATKQELRQKENAERKWERVQEVQRLRKQGYSLRRIGNLLSFSPVTVSNYLSMQELPQPYRSKRPKPIDAHEARVIEMNRKRDECEEHSCLFEPGIRLQWHLWCCSSICHGNSQKEETRTNTSGPSLLLPEIYPETFLAKRFGRRREKVGHQ